MRKITMRELRETGTTTWSKRDNSPRGCKTVSIDDLQIGDEIVVNNYFCKIIEDVEVVEEIKAEKIIKDYTKFMKIAIVCFIDRKTQDDHKSKLQVEALFSSYVQAEDNYIIRNKEIKRYILHTDDLERFEEFYNHLQDLKENYGDAAIYHLQDNNNFTVDEQNKFRNLLNAWTNFNEIV